MPSTSFPSERLSLAAERAGARGSRRRSRSLWWHPRCTRRGAARLRAGKALCLIPLLVLTAFLWMGHSLMGIGVSVSASSLRGNRGPSVNEPPRCAGIGDRRYQKPDHCARELPTVPVSGEKKSFLPRPAREPASVGTDGRQFWRSPVPALPTVPFSRAAVPRGPDVTHGTC